jgi:hypothetical protein
VGTGTFAARSGGEYCTKSPPVMTVMFKDQSSASYGVPDENLDERFGEDAINTRFLRVVDDVD